ncbi:MAG: ATP-binding cassette domain-containing protein [Spirochaetota bacterium]
MSEPILRVESLTKRYGDGCPCCDELTGPDAGTNVCPECGSVTAVRDVSLALRRGEILGVVGESGSGKSTLVQVVYFDVDATSGSVYLSEYERGTVDILTVPRNTKRHIRNHMMGMVYQNPMQGLRLRVTSGGNIAEKLLDADTYHFGKIRERARELLHETEIPDGYLDTPPAQLSGGMQQRVQISKAMANNPPILLLDEVTSGLDVSVQARVLDMVKNLQDELGISMLVVSHDMGVIRLLADRTIVMKHGQVVEQGLTDQILEDPQAAYTQLLVHSTL